MARNDVAQQGVPVTPDDNGTIPATFGLFIGGTGDVYVDMKSGGQNVPFRGVAAGTVLPISATRVYQTNTTATGIIALY